MSAISRIALLAVTLALVACASDWRSNTTASSGAPSYNLAIPGMESSSAPPPAATPKTEGDSQSSAVKGSTGG
jgi:hypothetical protein